MTLPYRPLAANDTGRVGAWRAWQSGILVGKLMLGENSLETSRYSAMDIADLCYTTRVGGTPALAARPVFAGERLAWVEPDERLIYYLPKTRPDGQTTLYLKPVEFLDRLATLVPRPASTAIATTACCPPIPHYARR